VTIVDESGDIQDGAFIELRREAPGSPWVTIYSDHDGDTTLGNLFCRQ
jgi:hypothetical protein